MKSEAGRKPSIEGFLVQAVARLERLYGAAPATSLLQSLQQELEAYSPADASGYDCRLWSQHDVIVINYADSICSADQLPLDALFHLQLGRWFRRRR